MKPFLHSRSSVKKFGGTEDDYHEIHDFIDSSKVAFSDNRHRALTHNSWFVFVVEKVFGRTIKNSNGKEVSVREIAEQHILEDFKMKYIPTPQDWLNLIPFQDWMNNGVGEPPPSAQKHKKVSFNIYD